MAVVSLIYICLLLQFVGLGFGGILECSDNSDCVADKSKCNSGVCECPFGEIFSLDHTLCLPIAVGIQADCKDDNQCAWLLGKYTCNNNKCECDEGWRYYGGRCIKASLLNERCTTNEECFNGYDTLAMICDGVCKCNKGYYLRGNYDCRPEATVIGSDDFCSLDSDCKIENSVCRSSHCVLKTDNVKGISRENKKLDPLELNNTIHSANYNKACSDNSECADLENGICYQLTKKCICKRGFFLLGDKCIPELGQETGCTKDSECKITPGRCVEGKCFCRKTYFSGKTNQACQKPMTQDNLFCNNAERCSVFGTEAYCNSQKQCQCKLTAELDKDFICRTVDGEAEVCEEGEPCTSIINSFCIDQKCQCKPNYRLENNACVPNIGAPCNEQMKCTIENSVCNENCICSDGFVTNQEKIECLPVATGLNDTCEIDTQCSKTVRFSRCFWNQCTCFNNFVEMDGNCYEQKFMGDLCTDVTQCHIMLKSKVQCRNSICQCSADMQPTENGLDCEPSGSKSSMVIHVGTIVLCITFHLILKLQVNI